MASTGPEIDVDVDQDDETLSFIIRIRKILIDEFLRVCEESAINCHSKYQRCYLYFFESNRDWAETSRWNIQQLDPPNKFREAVYCGICLQYHCYSLGDDIRIFPKELLKSFAAPLIIYLLLPTTKLRAETEKEYFLPLMSRDNVASAMELARRKGISIPFINV